LRFFSLFGWLSAVALGSSCATQINWSAEVAPPASSQEQARPWDAQDYQIALQLEEKVGRLHGVVKIQLEITRRTKHLILDAEGMEIQEVRSGYPVYSWDYDGHNLGIELESILDPGTKTWLEVSYSTTPSAGFFLKLQASLVRNKFLMFIRKGSVTTHAAGSLATIHPWIGRLMGLPL